MAPRLMPHAKSANVATGTAIVVIASASLIGFVTEGKRAPASDAKAWSLRGDVSWHDRTAPSATVLKA